MLVTVMRRVCALALIPAAAARADTGTPNQLADTYPAASYPGEQHLHFEFGPVHIFPGQNTISLAPIRAATSSCPRK